MGIDLRVYQEWARMHFLARYETDNLKADVEAVSAYFADDNMYSVLAFSNDSVHR